MESKTLPTPRQFLTNLLNTLSENLQSPAITSDTNEAASSNPLLTPSPIAKKLLLTLHVLFPTALLPALDLLDRNLITRLDSSENLSMNPADSAQSTTQGNLYFAKSSQQPSTGRYKDVLAKETQYYEVRTGSWNCSCPAFVFCAFPALLGVESPAFWDRLELDHAAVGVNDQGKDAGSGDGWEFGGRSFGADVPVCKHLLACVLIERVQAFASRGAVRVVSSHEVAGWCGGWSG